MGWFDVQLLYADKWAQITGAPTQEIRRDKLALSEILPTEAITTDASTQELCDLFTAQPNSDHASSHRFGAFDYGYNTEDKLMKIHFENPERGTCPLAPEKLSDRRAEFRDMLYAAREEHPEAEFCMSATWLRSTRGTSSCFRRTLEKILI